MGRLNKLYRSATGLEKVDIETIFSNIAYLDYKEKIAILGKLVWYIPGGVYSSKYDELKYLVNKKLFGNIIADIDLDKIVTVKDVALLRQAIEAKSTDTKYDVNRDNEVTEEDVMVAKMLTVSEDFDGFVILTKDDNENIIAVLQTVGLDTSLEEVTAKDLKTISKLPTVDISKLSTDSIWGDLSDTTFMQYLTSISEIPDYEFCYSTSLSSITIPSNVQSIGAYAFSNKKGNGLAYFNTLSSVTFNEGLTYVADHAFAYSSLNGDLVLPDSLETIGAYAFAYLKDNRSTENGALDTIYFGDNLTEICNNAFQRSNPNKIIFSEKCYAKIGTNAFGQSEELSYIDLGNVTYIGNMAFDNFGTNLTYTDKKLKYVTINMSKSVTTIKSDAFTSAAGTTNAQFNTYPITLPKTITRLEQNAFSNINLMGINYDGTVEEWAKVYRGKNWYNQTNTGPMCTVLTYVQCSDGQGSISYNII